MLIPIITTARQPAAVPPHILDQMLASNEVHAFERSSGWVVIGRDPIRAAKGSYPGFDRRYAVSSSIDH